MPAGAPWRVRQRMLRRLLWRRRHGQSRASRLLERIMLHALQVREVVLPSGLKRIGRIAEKAVLANASSHIGASRNPCAHGDRADAHGGALDCQGMCHTVLDVVRTRLPPHQLAV
jgi:hypothetical protein